MSYSLYKDNIMKMDLYGERSRHVYVVNKLCEQIVSLNKIYFSKNIWFEKKRCEWI